MVNILLVGLGGFIGSIARYLSVLAISRFFTPSFPYGTLFVNILGCLIIGLLAGLSLRKDVLSLEARLFLFTGILGGFTTFSAFGLETLQLLRSGQGMAAFLNILLQVGLGIGATALGFWLISHLTQN